MQLFKLARENLEVLLVLTSSQSLPVSPLGSDVLRFEICFEEKENAENFSWKGLYRNKQSIYLAWFCYWKSALPQE